MVKEIKVEEFTYEIPNGHKVVGLVSESEEEISFHTFSKTFLRNFSTTIKPSDKKEGL